MVHSFINLGYKIMKDLNGSCLDAVEVIYLLFAFIQSLLTSCQHILPQGGCTTCEVNQCDTSVGYGNHPDSAGGVTLDAMIMDGQSFNVGSVAFLSKYRNAASIARMVLEYTTHTLLVGEGAEAFAAMMGAEVQNTVTPESMQVYEDWVTGSCQPNFYANLPGSTVSCPPYAPPPRSRHNSLATPTTTTTPNTRTTPSSLERLHVNATVWASRDNHDTIGMVAVDAEGRMACGTTTNGANHKVRGRVGDSPIAGKSTQHLKYSYVHAVALSQPAWSCTYHITSHCLILSRRSSCCDADLVNE